MNFLSAFFATIIALQGATFTFAPTIPSEVAVATPAVLEIGPRASVIFGGDMMFDRAVRTTIEKNGGDHIFSCIKDVLANADLVVANLEGPITANASKSVGSVVGSPQNFIFTFPLSIAPLLAKHHIDMVNLGNNHIMNFGASGARSTRTILDAVGVRYFGDPLSSNVATSSIANVSLAFISYNEFIGDAHKSASTTIAQIKAARARGELPVVYTHWGIEYRPIAPRYVRDIAHRFADAGAAIVIGSHPHVVEDHETYRDVPIYYSLGNFIFDQYWEDAVRRGLLLRVVFTPEGVESIQEIPTWIGRDRRPCPI